MRPITIEELDHCSAEVEAVVDATPGIDRWCSGPDWQLPVASGFSPAAPRLLLRSRSGPGFALLSEYRNDTNQTVLAGLEPLWGFGSPILGPDPGAVANELADHLARTGNRSQLLIPGLPPVPRLDDRSEPDRAMGPSTRASERSQDGEGRSQAAGDETLPACATDPGPAERTTLPVARALATLGPVGLGRGITRLVVDLDQGFDAWLGRRSPRFRRNLRRAERAAEQAGLSITDAATDPDVFKRILAIERRSWKGSEGSGLTSPDMTGTYRAMVERLRVRNRLEAHVAVLGGRDVGYILGGVRARRYRGLQISFTADVAPLSVGNLLQAHQLRRLTSDDRADTYDLGMDFGYKRRWADRSEPSLVLVVDR